MTILRINDLLLSILLYATATNFIHVRQAITSSFYHFQRVLCINPRCKERFNAYRCVYNQVRGTKTRSENLKRALSARPNSPSTKIKQAVNSSVLLLQEPNRHGC